MKHIMNEYFEKIFLISSYATVSRLENTLSVFKREDINVDIVIAPDKRYFGTYNSAGIWAGKASKSLMTANESIYLKSKIDKYSSICVFEDDVFFAEDYKKNLECFLGCVPLDWDILNLGFHYMSELNSISEGVYHKISSEDKIVGAHAVAYKSTVYDMIINKLNDNICPIDCFLQDKIYYEVNSYIPNSQIFFASSYREYEPDKDKSYKYYKTSNVD